MTNAEMLLARHWLCLKQKQKLCPKQIQKAVFGPIEEYESLNLTV